MYGTVILGAGFFWTLVPIFFVGGVIAFAYFSWLSRQVALDALDTQNVIATTTEDISSTLVDMAINLKNVGQYQAQDRKENFLIHQLGGPHYTTLILSDDNLAVGVLLEKLIQDGWEVLSEKQYEGYQSQEMHLVVSKTFEDGEEERMVIGLKVDEYQPELVKSPTGVDLSKYVNINKKIEITSTVLMFKGDCGPACAASLRLALQAAFANAKVSVSFTNAMHTDKVPISVYSPSAGGFIPDNISVSKTSASILGLSYNIHRRVSGAKGAEGTIQSFKLNVSKFIDIVVDTCKPEESSEETPKKFNIGILGPPASGKSHLLKALLTAGAKRGIQIIKASADAFSKFTEDEVALSSLKMRAEKGPLWLVIDEGNGLPEKLVSALASVMDGLDANPNLSVILATNREEDLTNTELANLFRVGRVQLVLDVCPLEEAQWRPLLAELKKESPHLVWTDPTTGGPKTLGEIYGCGQPKSLEDMFLKMAA